MGQCPEYLDSVDKYLQTYVGAEHRRVYTLIIYEIAWKGVELEG